MVPDLDKTPWPTLGPAIVQLMEESLVFGPGDLRRQPYVVDDEDRALIYRMYEVYPKGHPQEGRRRFNRACVSRRKGTAKSEVAAALAAMELHPEAPIRCDGWRRVGSRWDPVGRPVTDPYIPLVAYTEEQSDDLAYAALLVMLSEGPAADLFDIGLERITRRSGDGKAVSLAGSPNARDGARTTFSVKDETHRWTTDRLRQAHRTMLANLPKRPAADPWELEITTRPEPGTNSVAEQTEEYARAVATGTVKDSRLLFFMREASDEHDLETEVGRMDALIEATPPSKRSWSNFPVIASQWQDPRADLAYLERVWLNRHVAGASRAFDAALWTELAVKRPKEVPEGALVTLGLDGSRIWDATAVIATEVASGYQWPLGIWERPPNVVEWEVPVAEVDAVMTKAFGTWDVWRLHADPPYWETYLADWAGRFGKDRVVAWWTNRQKPMAYALRAYRTAMRDGSVSHCPVTAEQCPLFTAHIGQAVKKDIGLQDDDGPLWVIEKERRGSPKKIDAAMAGCLSWEARMLAVTNGVLNVEPVMEPYYIVGGRA